MTSSIFWLDFSEADRRKMLQATIGVKSPIPPEPVQKMEKPKVDTSGVSVGVTVQHIIFGAGKVIELGDGFITVAFEQRHKRFEFSSVSDNGC